MHLPTKLTHSITIFSKVLANLVSETSCWYIPTPEKYTNTLVDGDKLLYQVGNNLAK